MPKKTSTPKPKRSLKRPARAVRKVAVAPPPETPKPEPDPGGGPVVERPSPATRYAQLSPEQLRDQLDWHRRHKKGAA